MHIQWYATVMRADELADAVASWAGPASLRAGATRFSVQRSQDDRYRILQQLWFESHEDWYRYWEGEEMREFRARYTSRYQVPIVYVWHEECASGNAPSDGQRAGSEPADGTISAAAPSA